MNSIKGIIFDYGGTLDTDGVHWFHIFRQAYAQRLPQVSEEQLRNAYVYAERHLATHHVIEPTDDFLSMLRKKIAIQTSQLGIGDDAVTNGLAEDCDALVRTNMQAAHRILDTLSARYPMVLVSNFYGNIHTVLSAYGLSGYFKEVIESAVVGVRKPDPKIFALGVEALGLQPHEVLVVGDSYGKDMTPAHDMGCQTIWLKGQGWSDKEEPTDSSCANHIIDTLTQVLEIIE